jgi:hypothetical protein
MVRRWLLELKQAGAVTVTKRQHSSAMYTVEKSVEKLRSELRSELRSDGPVLRKSISELKQSGPARKPPSSESELYRQNYASEYDRLANGWTEPAGRRVYGQLGVFPPADILPALADSARAAGLEPGPAILSLDRQLRAALQRVLGARSQKGLILHIARETWKAG